MHWKLKLRYVNRIKGKYGVLGHFMKLSDVVNAPLTVTGWKKNGGLMMSLDYTNDVEVHDFTTTAMPRDRKYGRVTIKQGLRDA